MSAAAVAVATPCCPAPVSAITRDLPIRRVSSACPSTLLILCEPVWLRSSRLSTRVGAIPGTGLVACSAKRRVQRLGDEPAAEPVEVTGGIRKNADPGTPYDLCRAGWAPAATRSATPL